MGASGAGSPSFPRGTAVISPLRVSTFSHFPRDSVTQLSKMCVAPSQLPGLSLGAWGRRHPGAHRPRGPLPRPPSGRWPGRKHGLRTRVHLGAQLLPEAADMGPDGPAANVPRRRRQQCPVVRRTQAFPRGLSRSPAARAAPPQGLRCGTSPLPPASSRCRTGPDPGLRPPIPWPGACLVFSQRTAQIHTLTFFYGTL